MAEVLAKTETQHHLSVSVSFMSLKMLADDACDLFLSVCMGNVTSQFQTHALAGGSRAAGFGLATYTPEIFS